MHLYKAKATRSVAYVRGDASSQPHARGQVLSRVSLAEKETSPSPLSNYYRENQLWFLAGGGIVRQALGFELSLGTVCLGLCLRCLRLFMDPFCMGLIIRTPRS
jgi:hypothetical protein